MAKSSYWKQKHVHQKQDSTLVINRLEKKVSAIKLYVSQGEK